MGSLIAANKWMNQGVIEHQNFVRVFKRAKEHALNAGLYFLTAKQAVGHGEWQDVVADFKNAIPERTMQHYMAFAADALQWAQKENPKLSPAQIEECARQMVLQSPKGLVALCRELQLMRKFGEYDSVKYAADKRKAGLRDGEQIEFDFDKVISSLSALSYLDRPDSHVVFTGQTPESLSQLETQLETALKAVRQARAQVDVESTVSADQADADAAATEVLG